MEYKTLHLAHDAGIATITLNRPDKRNAISYELIEDLLAALDEVANSSALVLILTGAGKAFCSGMDLDDLKALVGRSPEQSLKDSEIMARAVPLALRLSQADDCGGERGSHRGRLRACHAVRLHAGRARSQVRLHRSTNWIRTRDRFDFSATAGRRKACARPAADR